ncbi:MAG: hypothetical protein FWH35_06605 [Treponema sp.]|nr:hypothetical protein [Treponema sp.]
MESGFFDISNPRDIVIGAELARFLSVKTGDQVNLLSITGGLLNEIDSTRIYTISGIFAPVFMNMILAGVL